MSSLPLGICCNRRESLSSVSLQSLSTRHGFLGFFSKVHSPQSSMLVHLTTAGTLTLAVQLAVRLARASVAVPVTVMVFPASALVAVMVTVALSPIAIVAVLAEQLTTGGCGCLMVKFAEHVAVLFFFSLGSVMVAVEA